jgi:hypothetical protein
MARKPKAGESASEPADDLDRRAARLVDLLLEGGDLEPVNPRARLSLAGKLADLLQALPDSPDSETALKAGAAALDMLVDAPEVAEVFCDEARMASLLRSIWGARP